jgi:FAD/FMN-containing dehydrogenase
LKITTENISGWAKFPISKAKIITPTTIEQLKEIISSEKVIARGNGRSYGDSAINEKNTICMKNFNKFLSFDKETGVIVVESGVLLSEVIDALLSKGWFPLVTPGSKYVTIGGMVACNVHGKNHHKDGSFDSSLEWIEIINYEGKILKCSRHANEDLFNWTIGGMGLTGIITKVAFRLRKVTSSWIKQKTIVTKNFEDSIRVFEENLDSTYSVAWIDCLAKKKNLGRSLVMLGEHIEDHNLPDDKKTNPFFTKKKIKIRIPFHFLSFTLNFFTVKIFNSLYYFLKLLSGKDKIINWDSYFYPLDGLLDWNKIYGKKGFAQFQCVIPLQNAKTGIREILETTSSKNSGSFLAVLKRFGKQNSNISFPMEGYTLALDFPINNKNLRLLDELDEIVLKNNGRFYLAKDSRMRSEVFKKSDKRIEQFIKFKNTQIKNKFVSMQSERLKI